MTPERIVWEARRYLGVPFKHQGRSMAGVDCAGLVVLVGMACGLVAHDETGYPRRPDGYQLLSLLQKHLDRISNPQVGDVLLLAYHAYPQHLAIRTDKGIIHSYAGARKVVEHVYDKTWQDRLVYAFRFRGVEWHS